MSEHEFAPPYSPSRDIACQAPHTVTDEKLLDITGRQFASKAVTGDASLLGVNVDGRASPTPSSALSSIQDVSSMNDSHQSTSTPAAMADDNPRPVKRRKLTPAEKQEQADLKLAKAQQIAEQKAKRAEEKQVKDVEKRKKAEEREAKKRQKELGKMEKEQEKLEKEQEKLKKERSQMRLGAFFNRPSIEGPLKEKQGDVENSPMARRRSLSLETFNEMQEQERPKPLESIEQDTMQPCPKSDYQTHFLPFECKPGMILYQPTQLRDTEFDLAQASFDQRVMPGSAEEYDLGLRTTQPSLKTYFPPSPSGRGYTVVDVKRLMEGFEQPPHNTIDLTEENDDVLTRLSKVSQRYIFFSSDVRPAYFGTYTKSQDRAVSKKTRRKPFARTRIDTDYDYDSEAEWVEGGDGEDLGDEDSEADSEENDGEMDNFIDDAEDKLKDRPKAALIGKQPCSTGICWENDKGQMNEVAMAGLRLQVLMKGVQGSIDPFSCSYWDSIKVEKLKPMTTDIAQPDKVSNTNLKTISGWPISAVAKTAKKGPRAGTQKTMTPQDFENFKDVVVGSTLSKNELTNMLKEKFPFTSVLIRDTLSDNFAQVGRKDKKWIFAGATS